MILITQMPEQCSFMLDSGIRFVISPIDLGLVLAHRWTKDGNKLNNRRDNLRLASKSQQAANRKLACTNRCGFKGVIARRGRWQARIKKDGICSYSPLFSTPAEAHVWYVDKAKELHGEFARAK